MEPVSNSKHRCGKIGAKIRRNTRNGNWHVRIKEATVRYKSTKTDIVVYAFRCDCALARNACSQPMPRDDSQESSYVEATATNLRVGPRWFWALRTSCCSFRWCSWWTWTLHHFLCLECAVGCAVGFSRRKKNKIYVPPKQGKINSPASLYL